MYFLLFLWLISLLSRCLVYCTLVNFTVDDSDPSILYSVVGPSKWTARSSTETCTVCLARPDPSNMFNGTWHDSTVREIPPSNMINRHYSFTYLRQFSSHSTPQFEFPNIPLFANLTFNGKAFNYYVHLAKLIVVLGTAVYVFCALAESKTSPNGNSIMGILLVPKLRVLTNNTTDVGFFIDDELKGEFIKSAPGLKGTYAYNVPVFSVSSLAPDVEHRLGIQNGNVNGSESLMLLDYIIYSYVLYIVLTTYYCQ